MNGECEEGYNNLKKHKPYAYIYVEILSMDEICVLQENTVIKIEQIQQDTDEFWCKIVINK